MQTPEVSKTAIRTQVTKGPITVDDIHVSDFQKDGTESAQLRQVINVKSFYPSKRVDNNMQDNMFSLDEFGFEETEFESIENRVAFTDVPKGTTVETVLARIAANPTACLYKVLSNEPIITDNQEFAIQQGLRTKDEFANTQVVRYPEGTVKDNIDVSGQIVLDKNGNVQYRRVFFSMKAKEDIDNRSTTVKGYVSPEIEMELKGASVIEGQKI